MKRSDILFRQRSDFAKLEKQALQLEQMVIQQRLLIEELCSVACAWAWNLGAGVPELTDAEKRLAIEGPSAPESP